MSHILPPNVTIDNKFKYYEEQGYYVPYHDPVGDVHTYYAQSTWVLILDQTLKTFIGTAWVITTFVTILGIIKISTLVRNQIKYDELKEKWNREIQFYEDQQVIKEVNETYRKKLDALEDRFELYKVNANDLYKYVFFLLIVICISFFFFWIDYLRLCLYNGFLTSLLILIFVTAYQYIYKPLEYKVRLQMEIRRINRIIATQKTKSE